MTEIWILVITLGLVVLSDGYMIWKTRLELNNCKEMSDYYKRRRDSLSDALKEANDKTFSDRDEIERLKKYNDELWAKLVRVQKALDGISDVDVAPQKDLT